MKDLPRDVLLVVTATFFFFASLDFMGTVFPLYVQSMGGGEGVVGFLVGLMTFAAIIMRQPLSHLSKRYPRRVFYIGMISWTAAGVLYMAADSLFLIGAARMLQGMGPAAVISTTQILVAELAPRSARGRAIALNGMADNAGILIGPALGYWVFRLFGIDGFFLGVILLGLAAMAAMKPVKSDGRDKSPVIEAELEGTESRPRVFFGRGMVPILALGFSLGLPFGFIFAFIPLYMTSIMGNPSSYFIIMSVFSIAGRLVCGRLFDKRRESFHFILPGVFLVFLGFVTVAGSDSLNAAYLSSGLVGTGIGVFHTALLAFVLENSSQDDRAITVARQVTATDVGILTGSMGIGWVVEVMGVCSVAGLLGALILISGALAVSSLAKNRSTSARAAA